MNAKGIFVKWIVLWCCLVGQPGGAQGAQGVPSGAGSLDARFFAAMGVDPIWDGSPTVRRIVPQPDGRVWIGNNFKHLTNALPPNFRPLCGLFQPDGKLLLGRGASSAGVANTNSTFQFALVRLNIDGSLDSSFAPNLSIGVAGLEGGRDQIRIDALALQPDGKILIGGFFTRVQGEPCPLVARLYPDGQLDTEFGPDIEVHPGWDVDARETVSAMALTPDDGLLIGGVLTRINGLECHTLARLHTASETSGGILAFAQNAYGAWETNNTLEVTVLRYGPSNRTVSVIYDAPDLDSNVPVPGPQRGTLVFAPGESRKTITLPIQDNRLLDGNHSFHQLG